MKSLLITAAAALAIASAAVIALNGQGSTTSDLTEGAFPGRLPHSIGLPDSAEGVDQRVTELSPDRLFPKEANVDFKNGDFGREYHRDDGTLERIEVFYSTMPDRAVQLKWRGIIAADGVTYVSDSAFWADGTRKRIGNRLADGTYSIVTYFQNGTTENERTVLAADGTALFHSVTTENGILLYSGEKTKSGIEEKTFAENGNPVKYTLRSMFSSRLIEYFGDTGVPKADVSMDMYSHTVTFFAADGKVVEKRLITFGGMKVTVFENGVASYEQYWQRMNPFDVQKGAESEWQLYSVARVDSAELAHWKLWFRTGEAYKGKHTANFIYESKDELPTSSSAQVLVTNFDEGGCMFHRVLQDAQYGNPIKKETFPTDRGCSTPALPLELMKWRPFTPFTKKIPDPEPHHP